MNKPIEINLLDHVEIATPCTASWEEMVGDDRTRHCSHCSLNVYNISGMTSDEADALISGAEGRLCIRFHRRTDGTILTQDCPVGVRATRQRVYRKVRRVAATTVALLAGTLGFNGRDASAQPTARMGRMVLRPDPPPAKVDTVKRADTTVAKPDTARADTATPEPRVFMGAVAPIRREEPQRIEPTPVPDPVAPVDAPAPPAKPPVDAIIDRPADPAKIK